jgi:nitrogen regulatory protein PII
MKVVMAITTPQRLASVRSALLAFGARQMTVTQILSAVPEGRRRTEVYRGTRAQLSFVPRVRLEIVADSRDAYDLMRVIAAALREGADASAWRGESATIWVVHVPAAADIRTGLHQIQAL